MNFGYLLIVSTNSEVDYLKLAYALALSIKNTQKSGYNNVTLVINDITQLNLLKSSWVFDQVILWDQETYWDGRSWMDKLTPYEYTVCLDVDMLFFRDYSHYIDYFIDRDLDIFLPSSVFTYRGNKVEHSPYRKTFLPNDLPNVYSMYTFFKTKSAVVSEFFELNRCILKNPISFSNLFLKNKPPRDIGTDEAFALSASILGISDIITSDMAFPNIVHLKPLIQEWPWPADSISNHVGLYFDSAAQLKIGSFQQHNIVHYNEKTFVTNEILSILEEVLWKK
jgi:hypothetical protein